MCPSISYRWVRGFNDYDNWQASGVSGFGARSFYYPPKSQNCADCHMPAVASHDAGNIGGFVHSHRFVAANTAVPFSTGTSAIGEVEKFLQGGQRARGHLCDFAGQAASQPNELASPQPAHRRSRRICSGRGSGTPAPSVPLPRLRPRLSPRL